MRYSFELFPRGIKRGKALALITAHQELNCPRCEDSFEELSPEMWDSLGVKGLERMLAAQGGRLVLPEMASAYLLGFCAGIESVDADLWPNQRYDS